MGRSRAGSVESRRPRPEATLIAWVWTVGEWITSCLMPQASALATLFAIAMLATCPPWQKAFSKVSQERLYEITGIQFLPFNTIYQIDGARGGVSRRVGARRLLVDASGVFPIPADGRGGGGVHGSQHHAVAGRANAEPGPTNSPPRSASIWRNSRPSCKPVRFWGNCFRKSARRWDWRTRR